MTGYKRKILRGGSSADSGFTLIELMIVVVIISVIAAIAYPAYQDYVRESKRADAHAALMRIATLQEKRFSDRNAYAASTTTLGYAAHPAISNDGYWAITIGGVGPSTYTLTAQPTGGHVDADCTSIILDSAGRKTNVPAASDCW